MVLANLREAKIPLWADFAFLIVLGLLTAVTVGWQNTPSKKEVCLYLPGCEAEVHCDATLARSEQVFE